MVSTDGFYTFLAVQFQNITGQICFLGIINRMIKQGNICTGVNMCMYKLIKINGVNHVAWSNDNIWLLHSAQGFHIVHVAGDICVVDIIVIIML